MFPFAVPQIELFGRGVATHGARNVVNSGAAIPRPRLRAKDTEPRSPSATEEDLRGLLTPWRGRAAPRTRGWSASPAAARSRPPLLRPQGELGAGLHGADGGAGASAGAQHQADGDPEESFSGPGQSRLAPPPSRCMMGSAAAFLWLVREAAAPLPAASEILASRARSRNGNAKHNEPIVSNTSLFLHASISPLHACKTTAPPMASKRPRALQV